MKRIFQLAATLLVVPAVAVTMAGTASASSAMPTIATPGSHWVITTPGSGCENVLFKAGNQFVADEFHDKGTWHEPAKSSLTMTWTSGQTGKGTLLKATFNAASGRYKGTIKFPDNSSDHATVIPGTHAGC